MGFRLADYDWPAFRGRKPFNHQKITTEFLLSNPNCMVLNEMGTGKTLSALWAIDILIRFAELKRVYIVAPLTILKSAWAREIFFNLPHLKYAICHGTREYRQRVLNSDVPLVIINPDSVKGMHDQLMRRPKRKELLLIDESTVYKTPDNDRTANMTILADTFKGTWGMTGDAAPNKPVEAWSQSRICVRDNPLRPELFGRFRDDTMYKINSYMWGVKDGAEHLVAAILQPSIRFELRECIDLPESIYSTMEPELTREQQDAYDKMRDDLYLQTEKGEVTAANAAVKLMKLIQICAGSVKLDDTTSHDIACKPSLDQLLSIYEQTASKKLIIVCAFQASFRLLKEFGVKHGVKVGEIYGDVSLKMRDQYVERFQSGDLNWLIVQPQAAGHGLTLTAASHLVWWTLVPSNEQYKQTNARIVRPGQLQIQNIIRFVRSPAEAHISAILEKKEIMSSAILDLLKNRRL